MVYMTSMDNIRFVFILNGKLIMENLILDIFQNLNDYQKDLLLIAKLVAKSIAQKTLLFTNLITVQLFMIYLDQTMMNLAYNLQETYKEFINLVYK